MKYRCHVEIEYLLALADSNIIKGATISTDQQESLRAIVSQFSDEDANRIKEIESKINHDVKAIEYFIKEKLDALGMQDMREWVHFGLTSQDINNSAFPLMIREAYRDQLIPAITSVRNAINEFSAETKDVPMLAYTHGQPATPTLFGKEMKVFVERLDEQVKQLEAIELKIKFGYMVKYQTLFSPRPLILLIFNLLQQHYFLVLHLFNK